MLAPSRHHEELQVARNKLFHSKFVNAIMALVVRFSTKLGIHRSVLSAKE
jgi:hypothetical protein